MLQQKADACDTDPAAEAQKQRLGAGADQLDDVGVESDGGHSEDDKNLLRVLRGVKMSALIPAAETMVVATEARIK